MPAEVLVMCVSCRLPQAAGAPTCLACGARLPEVPLPAGPFLDVQLGGGRRLQGETRGLSFWRGRRGAPEHVALGQVRQAGLEQRPLLGALAGAALAAVALALAPWAWLKALLAVCALACIGAAARWRRYVLVLDLADGRTQRWPLGGGWVGSSRELRLREAWRHLSDALRPRGVQVLDGRDADA